MSHTKAPQQTPSQKSSALATREIKYGKSIPPPNFELEASQDTNVFKMATDLSVKLKGERAMLESEYQKLHDQYSVENSQLKWLQERGNKPRQVTQALAMENKAVQIQALFQKALALFEEGNRLQG